MNTRLRIHRHGTLGAALLLVCALLWAQALGLAHGIVHGPQLSGSHGMSQQAAAFVAGADRLVVESVWTRLLAAHQGDADCQLFDQLGHAEALPGLPLLALPVLAPLAPVIVAVRRRCAGLPLLFQARGPPLTR